MKQNSNNKSCADVMSNQCIEWHGGPVPCLGICDGDMLSEAEKTIADKVCALVSDLDMSKIDISCVLDRVVTSEDKVIKTLVQILFDNDCKLKDLIDASGGGTTEVTLKLNLKCLKKFDEFGNEIPQDLNQTLQSLVNQACQNKDDITSLKSRVTDLENIVDSIDTSPQTPQEPKIATCVVPGLLPVSQNVVQLSNAFCEFKNIVGTITDLLNALSQQPGDLNDAYALFQGWNTTVANLGQSNSNQWIVIGDLLSRVSVIEQNCCAVTCDDIKLGFEVTPNEDVNGIFLKFTSKAGTSIPIGFDDCGSIVVITDKIGNSVQYPLVVANNATEGDFDVTGLDLSDFLTIEVTAKLCADGIGCEKCVSRLYKMNNALCPFCEITVSGDEGSSITIIYEDL